MLVRIDATGSLIRCWRGCKMVQTLWKSIWQFLINFQIYTWPSIPTPGFVPQRSDHWSSRAHLYRNVFADRYTITEQWKQPGTIEQADGLTSWDGTTLLSNKNGWAIESCKRCISEVVCWVKKVSLKRIQTKWLHLYSIYAKAARWWWRTEQWSPGGLWGVAWRRFGGDGTTLVAVRFTDLHTH